MRRLWEAIQDNDHDIDKRDEYVIFLQQIADAFKERFDFVIGQFANTQNASVLPFAEVEKYEKQRYDVVTKDIETQLTSIVMILRRNGIKMSFGSANHDNVIGRTLSTIKNYSIACDKRGQKTLNIVMTAMFNVNYDKRSSEPMRCSIVNVNCNNLDFRKLLV